MADPSNSDSGGQTGHAADALVGTVSDDQYLDRPHDVEVDGDYAYLPGKGGTFGVVDVSDPGNPVAVGGLRGLTDAQTVGISPGEPVVFLSRGESVHAVDVSAPRSPEHGGAFETRANHGLRSPHDVARHDQCVVVVNQTQDTQPNTTWRPSATSSSCPPGPRTDSVGDTATRLHRSRSGLHPPDVGLR